MGWMLADIYNSAVGGFNNILGDLAGDMMPGMDGLAELQQTLAENPELAGQLSDLMGMDGDASPQEMLENLQQLAAVDPQILHKMNTVIEAKGFEAFLERVQGNEQLMEALQGQDNPSPEQVAQLIDGAYQRVEDDPQYFVKANEALGDGLISSIGAALGGSVENPWQSLDQAISMDRLMDQFSNGLDSILGEGVGQQIMDALQGILEPLMGAIAPVLQQTAEAAQSISDPAASADNGTQLAPRTEDQPKPGQDPKEPAAEANSPQTGIGG